ncbi:hypothetical protein BDV95DRAFT_505234 [Massariosphaeria phaeospora]|uniref:RNI-like protein n=1 Tax=Massariosphaeria phaeospora TaxID=100035 RepID=A0A7C8I6E2_9PLEO|nr:hypothetical protein BDV95DRAFT_505234 [Massariosphaeria phaeospora]
MEAPRRHAADPGAASLANEIAHLLYPSPSNSLGSLIKYEKDIVKLRRYVIRQRKQAIEEATLRHELMNPDKKILNQGAWDPVADPLSLNGAQSLPMPVQVAEHDTLTPFFEHLALNGTYEKGSSRRALEDAAEIEEPYYGTKTLEFGKGVVYSDRRMDLCKMVLGPPNIGDLLESLKPNTFITHFLLGNNIIGPHGAQCIVDFLKDFPNRMDTWYLAGNCIDAASFDILVDEWVNSTSVTNIWLKRNPLGPSAVHNVLKLVTETRNLRTLDLDQTELGDDGVADVFKKLATLPAEKPLPLRHMYLNATGIGTKAAAAIGDYLALPHCALDSLYMTNNPMGDAGVSALATGLKKNKSLTRLTLASVGMSDDGVVAVCGALMSHANLTTLDLGQSYATEDLGMRYNWITDRAAHAIRDMIASSPRIAYINLSSCAMTSNGLTTIIPAVTNSDTLLYYFAKSIYPQDKSASGIAAGQKYAVARHHAHAALVANVKRVYGNDVDYGKFMDEEKRWLVNDKTDVRKIDSVYRNRDAGLARRGLKKLDKWWDEDDRTLEEVMKSAAGPFCTKRRGVPVAS